LSRRSIDWTDHGSRRWTVSKAPHAKTG
jgi:hypothetical protein